MENDNHSDLLGFPATPWDLLAAPAPETLRRLEHPPNNSRPLRPQIWSTYIIPPCHAAGLACGTTSSQTAMSICDSNAWQRYLLSVPGIVYRRKIAAISALLGVSLPHEARSNARLGGEASGDRSAECPTWATGKRTSRARVQKRDQCQFHQTSGSQQRSTASESHACSAMRKYVELSRNWTPMTDIVLLGNAG